MLQCCVLTEVELVGIFCQVGCSFFPFLAAILNLKLEETFEECALDQLLQPMAVIIGSILQ